MCLVNTKENFAQCRTFHGEQPLQAALTVNKNSKRRSVHFTTET